MKTIKNWNQFNETLQGKVIYEMTGSPREALSFLAPKQRTKGVFAAELAKHGYVQGRLNKDCDLLVATSMDTYTNKMKKAEEMGVKVTTYAALIKKYKMFKDKPVHESYLPSEPGELLVTFDGGSPTTWFFIGDAIQNGILEDKLDMNDEVCQKFAEWAELEDSDFIDMGTLSDIIEQEFEETLDKIFDYLILSGDLDHKPTVEISGTDEEGEEYELSYFPDDVDEETRIGYNMNEE